MSDEGKLQALKDLETYIDKFQKFLPTGLNIYEITGMGSQETKHSNTIAWFLDPSKNHKLGSFFFKEFLKQLFNGEKIPDCMSDYDDIKVKTEVEVPESSNRSKGRIDILIISESKEFVLCIENKVWADLSKDQLDRYYDYVTKEYGKYKHKFVLLSPTGKKVPDTKSKKAKEWISAEYEIIVNILRDEVLKKIDQADEKFKQKMQYIINDYIEFLENEGIVENSEFKELRNTHQGAINLLAEYQTQEHFVDNTELNNELNRLYEEHQEVVNFLVIRQTQSNPLKDVFLNTLTLDKFKGKIIKSSASNSFREFYTKNMEEHFEAKNDKSGFWKNGLKYKYLFVLEEKFKKPRIILQLSPKDQDDETKANFNQISKTKIASNAKCKNAQSWDIDIDLSNLSRIDEKSIENEISKTLEEIITWDEKLSKILK